MDNISSNIKDRILEVAEYKGLSKEPFLLSLGQTYGNYKGKSKNSSPSADVIAEISTKYPEISLYWLLTGKGRMLIAKGEVRNHEGVPLIPIEAVAGKGDEADFSIMENDIQERYVVPLFDGKEVDFLTYVRGSSMYPKYGSGDVVACRFIRERLFVQWNKVYVIDTVSQGVMIKRLRKSSIKGYVTFRSDNKEYDDFDVPDNDIRNLALVIGVIRLE